MIFSVLRGAAIKIKETEYLTIGHYLETLNKSDLAVLVSAANEVTLGVGEPETLEALIVLADMLTAAEGSDVDTVGLAQRVSTLMIFITFEDLYRKGIIDFDRSSATLSDTDGVQNIAKLK